MSGIIKSHILLVYALVFLEFFYLIFSQFCNDINKFISKIIFIEPLQILMSILILFSGIFIEATKGFFNFKFFLFLCWLLIFYLNIKQIIIIKKIKKTKQSFNYKLFALVFESSKIFLIVFAGVINYFFY